MARKAVKGSHRDNKKLTPENIALMCHATTRESVDKIQSIVQGFTPKDTWKLHNSIVTTPTTHPYSKWYRAKVITDDPKAKHIEYGTSPHPIPKVPTAGSSVKFGGKHYSQVDHPGNDGFHMFQRGAKSFEVYFAEHIATMNARKFLR